MEKSIYRASNLPEPPTSKMIEENGKDRTYIYRKNIRFVAAVILPSTKHQILNGHVTSIRDAQATMNW